MKKITQIAVLGSAAVLVAGLGTAYAAGSAAAPPPVIHACKATRDGNVRIVAKSTRCKRGETRVTWNQKGVTGPRGPAGPAGPSNGYVSFGPDSMDIPQWNTSGDDRNVVTLQLPAGSYVLTGIATFFYSRYVECGFTGYKRTATTPTENSTVPTHYATITITTGVTLAQPGSVSVVCHSPQFTAVARRPVLTAVKAGTLQTTGTAPDKASDNPLRS